MSPPSFLLGAAPQGQQKGRQGRSFKKGLFPSHCFARGHQAGVVSKQQFHLEVVNSLPSHRALSCKSHLKGTFGNRRGVKGAAEIR